MGVKRDNGGGTFVPEAVDLQEDFYEANYENVHLSSKEYEGEKTEYAYLIFDVDGHEITHRVPAKMSVNGDDYPNSALVDTLDSLGLWDTAAQVVEEVVGEDGLAEELKRGDASYVVEGEVDYEEFKTIINGIFAGKTLRVLVETYEVTISEDQAEESRTDDSVPTYQPGDSVKKASIDKLSSVEA